MNTLLTIAVFLSIGMGGVGCIKGRERLVRWMGGAACLLLVVYAVGQLHWIEGEGMVRKKTAPAESPAKNGPANGDGQLAEAVELFKARRFAKAHACYLAAFDAGADKVLSLHGAANCSFVLRDDETLQQDAARLHGFDKGKAHFWRGQMYRRQGERSKAEYELEMAVMEGYDVAADSLAALRKELAVKKGG